MCTVIVSAPGSGMVSTLSPFASRYSVTPSIEVTREGSSAAAAASASASRKVATARRFKLLLAELLADAALALLALLVLAGFAHFLAPCHALLALRFASRRVLGLRAHLVNHALLALGA